MPSQILEPTILAGTSSDVTIAAGSTNTVAMFQPTYGVASGNLKLPNAVDDFLLPDGVSFLLLPAANQDSGILDKNDWADIQLKDPNGNYQPSGLQLRHNGRFKTLGPGVWRLVKTATPHEFGFQSE